MRNLTLISDIADRELDAIRRTVKRYDPVGSHESLIAVLREHGARGTHAEVLDLVGHSRDHGFLSLGTCLLDDAAQTEATFRHEVAPALDAIGVRMLRFLGCSTAASERALTALARIAVATRRRVYGTRRYVSQRDYGPEGFISDHALIGPNGGFEPMRDSVGFLSGSATTVRLTSLALTAGPRVTKDHPIVPLNAALVPQMLSYIEGSRSWAIAGLLAEPSVIVLWSEANAVHRLDVLCDYQVVRGYGVYPDDEHGRLFRVRDPEGLNHHLQAWLRPRSADRARTT